jgi:hypothetical protein
VMKHCLSMALAALAVTAVSPAVAQISTGGIQNFDRIPVFNLAEAYPCNVGTYAADQGIADPQIYCGRTSKGVPPTAAPGFLALARNGLSLNVNCFAVAPAEATNCIVQAYRFFKMVPGSFKCPDVYGLPHFDKDGNLQPYIFIQFGSGIRTWWSLNFTQPGTRFLLQVVSACQVPRQIAPGRFVTTVQFHVDSWRWRVVADENTLASVIDLMHSGAISTLEVPCIIGEDMYDALQTARKRIADAVALLPSEPSRQSEIGNAIFDMEALIVANCLFVEVLNPLTLFPGPDQFSAPNILPPGNLAPTVFFGGQGAAVAGVIDTIEHPCCCKLLVDLEWIAIRNGIIGQSPTLPTF